MGIISGIGLLLSGAVKFLPGLHRYALYAVAGVSILGMGALYIWNSASEGKAEALARVEAACALERINTEAAFQKVLAEILAETADAEAPATKAEVDDYCRASPALCRTGATK